MVESQRCCVPSSQLQSAWHTQGIFCMFVQWIKEAEERGAVCVEETGR